MVVVKYWFPIAILKRLVVSFACAIFTLSSFAALNTSEAGQPAVAEVANSDAERLSAQLERLEGYRHPFVQQVYSATGQLLETSEGEIAVERPNVRWEIASPFPQTILLLKDVLKIYDPDLEQVTVRELEDSWSEVPLALLINGTSITEHFRVVEFEAGSFLLQPLASDSLLREIRIEWASDQLDTIQIYDHTSQLIVVQFDHQSIRQVIQSDSFELALPPGTEVVRG